MIPMHATLLNVLVPIYVGLLIGWFAGRGGIMDTAHVKNLTSLVMDFTIPCAMFAGLSAVPKVTIQRGTREAMCFSIIFSVVFIVCYQLATRYWAMSMREASMLALTIGFPNSAAVGLPLLSGSYGASASVSAVLSLAVGAITVTPIAMALIEETAGRLTFRSLARNIAQSLLSPIVWSPLLAIGMAFMGWHMPSYVIETVRMLGNAAIASALLLTGLVLAGEGIVLSAPVFVALLLKLVVQPLLAIGVGHLFRLAPDQVRDVAVVAATPGGFFGVVIGRAYGSRSENVSAGLAGSYVLSVGSLPIWLKVFA